CVPEYGTANGRLHFHAVHFMRTLPTGSVDPNFGRRVRNRRQLNSLQNTWPYGYSMPIAVRYTQDAFSRSGWLWPVDAKGELDNRIKLLEEILSFRMQGVEFDNGDIYVDGHKAASDVRDEFVSVTEKLMDELA